MLGVKGRFVSEGLPPMGSLIAAKIKKKIRTAKDVYGRSGISMQTLLAEGVAPKKDISCDLAAYRKRNVTHIEQVVALSL